MSTLNMTEDGWRLSSYTDGVQCLGVKEVDGEVAVTNTKRRGDGELAFTKGEMSAFIQGVKDGEYDDLIV